MYKTARTIAAEGATITKGFHNLRRIPRRLLPHCGNLNPTYVGSGNEKPPFSGLCLLPPAADIRSHRLSDIAPLTLEFMVR